ncbi:Stk1 family PASTA domain-containing Ser/Thr kinase [Peptostreptococcus porci]|uniref:Stk1 family PASTA domain-containing Ser/Thr kinase n=1 Tax=Peptostreptococcus porci TaxID=2652282 RepID=UPI002A802452|nr:Stk1 family PASTA domain-containing Ser/Thr kinase [Peptostreptococcus porci]MDY4128906.1 Stk1 family PASTA domain-containing Ser/Thr kinase [Peptostreptococcus porci]
MGATVLGNRYEILRKIGDGGMAFVYQARDRLLNRIVAVKVLRPEFVDDQEFLVKFKREAEAVASLSHPNIVNVYDVGEDGKVHYIVMEYVDGQNLKEIIQKEGSLEEYTALDITKQIANALGAAHRSGIIHRDIKPHNILISKDGRQVKVADFGIAKAVSSSTMTNMGSVIGSVHYISPEQAKGKHLTSNADLYSLGIVLYEMILGKVPFSGDSPISIALKHINENISFSDEEKRIIPNSIRTIISKLTQKEPVNRYETAEELIEDIEFVEKNIDLPYMKDYDNFATEDITRRDYSIFKGRTPIPFKKKSDEEEYYDDEDEYYDDEDEYYDDDEEYYDDDEEYYDDDNSRKSRKELKKEKKKNIKKESPKTRRRLKILAVILILILIGYGYIGVKYFGLGSFISRNSEEEVVVPDVQNMTIEEAQNEVRDLGLNIELKSEEFSSQVSAGRIITQTPIAGSKLKKGDSISVIISRGNTKVPVPNVVGMKLSDAEKLLNDNGLLLGNVKYQYNSAKEGTVLEQSLLGGSSDEGQKVSLVVSKGKETSTQTPSIIDDSNDTNTDINPGIINNGSSSSRSNGNSGTSRSGGSSRSGGTSSGSGTGSGSSGSSSDSSSSGGTTDSSGTGSGHGSSSGNSGSGISDDAEVQSE